MSIIPGSAARIETAPACAPVPTPAITPVVLTDGYALLTDGDACTSVSVDQDAWEDGAATPVARACSTTDGVCDACAAEAEGSWDGYGLYTHVIA